MENDKIEILEDANKKKGSKRPYVIAIVLALALVVTITATSYAYFVANVSGTSQNTVVTTAALEIEFTDGPTVSLQNAIPGQYIEKTFKVENKGSGDTTYDVYMSDLINDFSDKSDLVYTLTSNDGGYNVSSETQVPSANAKIVNAQLLRAGEAHNYTLRISFLETNDNQDDNKGKSFNTIIRVNEVHDAPPTAVQTITSLAVTDDTIVTDGTEDNNLRYIGANPNNYVQFNNELWRIIGVMNNIETAGGQTQSLLKIRRAESLGNYSWDSSASGVNSGQGVNEWTQADLMQELNQDYLGNVTIGTDGNWYNSSNNEKSTAKPSSTISSEAQNQIESVKWKLGSPNNNNGTALSYEDTTLKAPYVYQKERSNYTGKVCTTRNSCNDTVTRTTSWTGKVGLFYASDYLYATSGGNATNRESCLNTHQSGWSDTSVSDCKNNSWLNDSSSYQWTLSPFAHKFDAQLVFHVSSFGHVGNGDARNLYGVRPVVFLKSSISITGGDGSSTNPYTIG